MCDKTHSCVTWLIRRWYDSFLFDMTHSYVGHDSFICVTWLNHHTSGVAITTCVTCLIHMCDMTHSYVWHDSFICVTWLIHLCDMTHSDVWRDSFKCVTWPIHTCDMTYLHVRGDEFIIYSYYIQIFTAWSDAFIMHIWMLTRLWLCTWMLTRLWT